MESTSKQNQDGSGGGGERKRRRGRKPKCEFASLDEIRKRISESGDKVIFSYAENTTTPRHKNLEQKQIPFGNLNITVHSSKEVDKQELRNMFKNEPSDDSTQIVGQKITSQQNNSSSIQQILSSKTLNEIQNTKTLLTCIKSNIERYEKWPEKTDKLCWWCCFQFNTIPIPAVRKYDSCKKRFILTGNFCTWECAAAFSQKENLPNSNLYLLKIKWTGDKIPIRPAPTRYVIKEFGGHMDIDTYRKSTLTETIKLSTYDFSYVNQEIIEYKNTKNRTYKYYI